MVLKLHQYGISAFFSQTSFTGEKVGWVTKCWLFSQAIMSPETFDYQCSEKVHKFNLWHIVLS